MKPVPHVCPACGAPVPSTGTGAFTCKQCGGTYRIDAPVQPVQPITYVTNNYHAAPTPVPAPAPKAVTKPFLNFWLAVFMLSMLVTVGGFLLTPSSIGLSMMMYGGLAFVISGLFVLLAA